MTSRTRWRISSRATRRPASRLVRKVGERWPAFGPLLMARFSRAIFLRQLGRLCQPAFVHQADGIVVDADAGAFPMGMLR